MRCGSLDVSTIQFARSGTPMLIPIYLLFALCVGLTVVEIPSAEARAIDLLIAVGALAYFVMGGWLIQGITAVLKDLNGQ